MADAGLNAVDVYYPWSYHAERPGELDFAGLRDVEHLHDLIERAGLYLIARPGPYVCAELDFGGLPAWLLRDESVTPRCRTREGYLYSRAYLDQVRGWFEAIVPRIAARANLLLFQIENEYALPSPVGALSSAFADLAIRWLGARRLARIAGSPWLRRRALGGDGEARRRAARPAQRLHARPVPARAQARRVGADLPQRRPPAARPPARRGPARARPLPDHHVPARLARRPAHLRRVRRRRGRARRARTNAEPGLLSRAAGRLVRRLGRRRLPADPRAARRRRHRRRDQGRARRARDALDLLRVLRRHDLGLPGEPRRVQLLRLRRADRRVGRDRRPLRGRAPAERVRRAARGGPRLHRPGPRAPAAVPAALRDPARRSTPLRVPAQPDPGTRRRLDARARARRARPVGDADPCLRPNRPTRCWPCRPSCPRRRPRSRARCRPRCRGSSAGASRTRARSSAPATTTRPGPQLSPRALATGAIDLDALGLHWGFVWYRGRFFGALDRLVLDARHCWAVWINGKPVASGDQLEIRSASARTAPDARACRCAAR